jgi:hypothetical protein
LSSRHRPRMCRWTAVPPKGWRRRRRPSTPTSCASPSPSGSEDSGALASSVAIEVAPTIREGAGSTPLYIFPRSSSIDQAEADLQRALLVTVGGNRPSVASQQVLEAMARSYNVELSLMWIWRVAREDFLLLLPDRATADQVLNGSSLLLRPGFTLFFKHWTRLTNVEAVVLPVAVDVELRGVPAHAWEGSTTQVLLGGSCLVCDPLPFTAVCHDCSKLCVTAWAANLDSIPSVIDLLIPDLPPVDVRSPRIRQGLLYMVHVSVLPDQDSADGPQSPAPDCPEQGWRRRRRR